VIASTLLGTHPPRLSSQLLVRSGELFGIAEGTTRTAISRMVAAGELEPEGSAYRLAGSLLARQERQDASRRPVGRRWNGLWEMAVVAGERRTAASRTELRVAMQRLKLAELREGVWMRPDNLAADRFSEDRAIVETQCRTLRGEPHGEAGALAAELWDLSAWSKEARELWRGMDRYLPRLEQGDTAVLRDGFVLSAAVLRHLVADPMLPPELLPANWPGPDLRERYERYDIAFKDVWRTWFRAQTGRSSQG
jgi:phenylacetic acid degradation operon negative regulatory protein